MQMAANEAQAVETFAQVHVSHAAGAADGHVSVQRGQPGISPVHVQNPVLRMPLISRFNGTTVASYQACRANAHQCSSYTAAK